MLFYIIDAFSEEKFGGNQAGVVLLDNKLEESVMQKTATELRFSETAFIEEISEKEFKIRYFTPSAEVELCGHATIASFVALLNCGKAKDNTSYTIDTLSGKLTVQIKDGFIMMGQTEPKEGNYIEDCEEIARILGISKEDIGIEGKEVVPQSISTGLFDIMLPVKNKEVLFKIKPDFKELSLFSKKQTVVGLHAFTVEAGKYTACCRNFAPLYDINEEAATGTSNGALTYYLYKNNFLKEGELNTFLQGETMNRPSTIITRITNKEGFSVEVGGKGVVLSKGEIYL